MKSQTLNQRYGLEMDPDSIPGLVERFGLRLALPGRADLTGCLAGLPRSPVPG